MELNNIKNIYAPVNSDLEKHEDDKFLFANKITNKTADEQPPHDRLYLVYIIFLLHGIGTLMPWNIFINATDYYTDYKLNTTISVNASYRVYFLNYVGFAAQIPSMLLSIINVFYRSGGGSTNLGFRVVITLMLEILVFAATVVLAIIDSYDWPYIFFLLTIFTVVLINSCTGMYQSCVYSMASMLPMRYTNAVVLGSNISGTLIAIVNIITKSAASTNRRTSAVYYFVFAIIVLLLCFDTYFVLPYLRFYRFYFNRAKSVESRALKHNEEVHDADGLDSLLQNEQNTTSTPPTSDVITTLRHCFAICCFTGDKRITNCHAYWHKYWVAFKMCWVHCLSVWSVFFCTLSVFPAIQVYIERTDENNFIPQENWVDITCFLLFNMFAMLGNLVSNFIQFPKPKYLFLFVWTRTIFFIPFFILCNFKPASRLVTLPVLISNDYAYIIGVIVFAFTSGYFSSLCMMYAPRACDGANAGLGAGLSTMFLILGVVSGINMSAVLVTMVAPLSLGSFNTTTALSF